MFSIKLLIFSAFFLLSFAFSTLLASTENLEPNIHYAKEGEDSFSIIDKYFPREANPTEFQLRSLIEKIKKWNPEVKNWHRLKHGEKIFVGHINTDPFIEFIFSAQLGLLNFSSQLTPSGTLDFSLFREALFFSIIFNTPSQLSFILNSSFYFKIITDIENDDYTLPSNLNYGGGLRWKLSTDSPLFFDLLITKEAVDYIDVNKERDYSLASALSNLKTVHVDLIDLVGSINYFKRKAHASYHLTFKKSFWGNAVYGGTNYREDFSLFSYSFAPVFHLTESLFLKLEYEKSYLAGVLTSNCVNYSVYFGFSF